MRSVVEEHGGSIRVEDNQPAGTRFVIELPAVAQEPVKLRRPSYERAWTRVVVDDEAGIREMLTGVLEDEGYAVEVADSGERCLEMLSARSYAVVLLDIWLPGIDGLETLERIRDDDMARKPVVVMISGHGSVESAVRATKLGAHDFLEKPLSVAKVSVAVRNALSIATCSPRIPRCGLRWTTGTASSR